MPRINAGFHGVTLLAEVDANQSKSHCWLTINLHSPGDSYSYLIFHHVTIEGLEAFRDSLNDAIDSAKAAGWPQNVPTQEATR